jgi:hypothetical protein
MILELSNEGWNSVHQNPLLLEKLLGPTEHHKSREAEFELGVETFEAFSMRWLQKKTL